MARPRYLAEISAVPRLKLGQADVEFSIRLRNRRGGRGSAYGVVAVSRGALVWRSARGKVEYRLTWPVLRDYAILNGERLRRLRHGKRAPQPKRAATRRTPLAKRTATRRATAARTLKRPRR